eukprot:476979_1
MGNTPDREDRKILEVSKRRQKLKSKSTKELNVFMVGLDGSGKSTILYKHLMGSTYSSDSIHIPPTITYNMETIKRPKTIKIRKSHSKQSATPPMPPVRALNPAQPQLPFRSSSFPKKKSTQNNTEQLLLNIYDYGGQTNTRALWINYKDLKIEKLRKTGNRIDFFILVIDCTDVERLNDEHNDSVQLALKPLLNMNAFLKIPLCIFANKQDLRKAIAPHWVPYRLGIKQITVWNLIANVKYVHDVCLPWKLSAEILSYEPNPNYHWNMSKRRWTVIGTETVSDYNKGIHDGIQWVYSEYDRQKQKTKSKRRHSLTHRLKLTM